jgi:4-hydroxy-tetrahydrodipicolinate reductase
VKITIIGYGKMGHAIAEMARQQGISIASIVDPSSDAATHKSITEASMKDADVAIDFTTPNATIENIEKVAQLGKNMVVGTTGWYNQTDKAKRIIKKGGTGLICSPNFSIGVSLFFRIVANASMLMNRFSMYDPFVYEIHHKQKTDAPGGTAKILGAIVVKNIDRKKKLVFDRINNRKIAPNELQIASIRAGYMPGTHVVGFDGEADTIELRHTARSRTGFAEGAIAAARWIKGKRGFYTFEDMISEILGE